MLSRGHVYSNGTIEEILLNNYKPKLIHRSDPIIIMRVLKIIQANPTFFKVDQNAKYSDLEAIRVIASLEGREDEVQFSAFDIRQTFTAILNLVDLGYLEEAIELAITLIPKAELAQEYRIAQDLCKTIITYFLLLDDLESVHLYQSLYDKLSVIVYNQYESINLFGRALSILKKNVPSEHLDVENLLNLLEKKISPSNPWYHYYYFQFKSLIMKDEYLERLYIDSIDFFNGHSFNHPFFVHFFTEALILFYLRTNSLEKVNHYLNSLVPGSIFWFRGNLSYAKKLLHQNDIKSIDICHSTMNHPLFSELNLNLKKEWRLVYKRSVSLLPDN
jgi:hypothetical protein